METLKPPAKNESNMQPETNKERLIEFAIERSKEILPDMEARYEDLHENPELGGQEIETSKKVVADLESLGIEVVREGIGIERTEEGNESTGTGVVAIIRGNNSERVIALRADMDALPIEEDEKNPVKSLKPGLMHGCGHDIHTAALLGAAKILKEIADKGELAGDVVLLFQPSEEKAFQKESGAVQMVKFLEKSGMRENIGAVFGQHVMRNMERGQINVKEGMQNASSGEVDIVLKTEGGHVMNAYDLPNLNRVFAEINSKLYEEFEPTYRDNKTTVAATRTDFAKGAYNVLPASGASTWVIRVTDEKYREISNEVMERIRGIVASVVEKYGKEKIDVALNRRLGYRPIVHRDPKLVDLARETSKRVLGDDVGMHAEQLPGGEDFSFYLEELRGKEIPGVFLMVGGANSKKGIKTGPHHTPDFQVDPEVLSEMAGIHATYALEYLSGKDSEPAEAAQ